MSVGIILAPLLLMVLGLLQMAKTQGASRNMMNYQHTINRSVFYNDSMEFIAETLLPSLDQDLRFLNPADSEAGILKIGSRTVNESGLSRYPVANCSRIFKMYAEMFYGLCEDNTLFRFGVEYHELYVTKLPVLEFSKLSSDTSHVTLIDVARGGESGPRMVLTKTNHTENQTIEVGIWAFDEKREKPFAWTALKYLPVRIFPDNTKNKKLVSKMGLIRLFSGYANYTSSLLVSMPDNSPQGMGIRYLIVYMREASFKKDLDLELGFLVRETDSPPTDDEPLETKAIGNFTEGSRVLGFSCIEGSRYCYMLLGRYDELRGKMVLALFPVIPNPPELRLTLSTDLFSLQSFQISKEGADNLFTVGCLITTVFSRNAHFAIIVTTLNLYILEMTFDPKLQITKFSNPSIYDFGARQLGNDGHLALGVDATGRVNLLLKRNSLLPFLVTFVPGLRNIRIHRDPIMGKVFFFLLSGTPNYKDYLFGLAAGDKNIEQTVGNLTSYILREESISTDFASIKSKPTPQPQRYETCVLGSTSDYVRFNLEVFTNSQSYQIPSYSLKPLEFQRLPGSFVKTHNLYYPLDVVDYRLTNVKLNLKVLPNDNVAMQISDNHLVLAQDMQFSYRNISSGYNVVYDYLPELPKIKNLLGNLNFTMVHFENNTIEIFSSNAFGSRGLINMSRILCNYTTEATEYVDFAGLKERDLYRFVILGRVMPQNHLLMHIVLVDSRKHNFTVLYDSQYDKQIVFSSVMFDQERMLLVAVVRDLLFPDIYPDSVMYLSLPNQYTKFIAQRSMSEVMVDIPLIGHRIDSFHRTTFDSVVITNQFYTDPARKERRGTNVFNITQIGNNNFPVLMPMVLTNFEDLYIFRSFLLCRRKNDSMLVLLKRGSGTSTDLFNLELPPVKNLSDIKFFRGLGAHGYLAINNTVYILDMLEDDQDCLKRIVKTLQIDPKVATFCPDGLVAGMSQVFSMVSYLWYLPASRDSFVSLILDIYGPTFPTSITIQDNSNKGPQFSLESTLMGQKRPISTIRQETKILTKSWLVAAAAIGQVDLRGNDPKNLTISLSDQIAIASDISDIKLVQPGPSIGYIRQAVRKTTNRTFNLSAIPDITFSKSSTSYQHEQYLVYKNKTNLQVYNLNKYSTPENQGNATIQSLLVDIKIDFVAENFDIDSLSKRPSEVFMVALTEQSESGYYNLHVFVFPEADPSKYSKFTIPSACKCRTVRIELINTYRDLLNYGLVHAELNELGNTIVTSLLEVNRTADPVTKDFKYGGYIKTQSVFQKYIRYRILDINMFSSENTLLLYYFIQNSGYMGIISLAFRDDGSLEKSRYRLSKMCNEFVVTRGSLIECKPREQELCLDCLFFSQHKMGQVHQLSLQFSLDDSNLMVPKHSPHLMLPTGYSVIKIKKAAAANIVLALDEKTKEKCFLFFDSVANLVVQRMCTTDFEKIYADLKIEGAANFLEKLVTISEVSVDTFIFAVEGMNLRDLLFNIGDYELVVDPKYFQGQSNYLGYHIDIENLSGKNQTIYLEDVVLLDKRSEILKYVLLFGGAITLFLVGICCLVLSMVGIQKLCKKCLKPTKKKTGKLSRKPTKTSDNKKSVTESTIDRSIKFGSFHTGTDFANSNLSSSNLTRDQGDSSADLRKSQPGEKPITASDFVIVDERDESDSSSQPLEDEEDHNYDNSYVQGMSREYRK